MYLCERPGRTGKLAPQGCGSVPSMVVRVRAHPVPNVLSYSAVAPANKVQPPLPPPHHYTSPTSLRFEPLTPHSHTAVNYHGLYLPRLTTRAALLLASAPRPRCHTWQLESSAARLIIGLCAQFLLLIILPITSAARTACAFLNNPVAI